MAKAKPKPKAVKKKSPVRKPTPRQIKAANEMVANGGNMKAALKKAGYSPAVQKNPHKVTRSKTWKQLMDEYLPEDYLAEKHRELMEANSIHHYVFPHGTAKKDPRITDAEIRSIVESVPGCRLVYIKLDKFLGKVAYYQSPDNKARKDALDMAFKLRGSYSPEKIDMKGRFSHLSNAELAAAIAKVKKQLLKK